ncbi:MAG: heavy-metal-associated domain-containing protein [Chitinophagaceae bacterium]
MKNIFFLIMILSLGLSSQAQFTKASLQASGLTCSMCSKAVKNAIETVPSVDKVMVDIKNQQYNISFKPSAAINFDDLSKAVEDAGFSVANLKVTAKVSDIKVEKDEHYLIDNKYFHFLNGYGKQLNGETTFTLVDKSFVSAKEFKKFSSSSKMKCVQTGKAAECCQKDDITEQTRIFHVII